MSELRIELLGGFRLRHGPDGPWLMPPPMAQEVFAYLVLDGRHDFVRQQLARQFWRDRDDAHARASLNAVILRLRRCLEPAGIAPGTYIVSSSNAVGFNWSSNHFLDVVALGETVAALVDKPTLNDSELSMLHNAVDLYRGRLLPGVKASWIEHERARARIHYLAGLRRLLAYYQAEGAHERVLELGLTILWCEPTREDVHRAVISSHLAIGDRHGALQQYDACRAALAEFVGVEPLSETQALVAGIGRKAAAGRSSADEHVAGAR